MKTKNLQDKISSERSLPPINPRIPDDSIFDRFAIDHGLPRLEYYRNMPRSERSPLPIGSRIPDDYFDDCFFDRFAPPGGLKLEDIREMSRYREVKKEKYLSGTLQKVFSAIKTYFQKQKI